MGIEPEWASQLAEGGAGQADRSPLGTAHADVLAVLVEGHRPKQVFYAAELEQVGRVAVQRNRRPNAIHEHEKGEIIGAEQLRPASEAIDVFLRGPTFPCVARLVGRSAWELPSLDIHEQPGPIEAQHNEVEILDGCVAETGAARFIHGDIAEAIGLEVCLECRFIGVAAIHGPAGKFEIRISKSETNSKLERPNADGFPLEPLYFGFWVCFGFRHSDFEFHSGDFLR